MPSTEERNRESARAAKARSKVEKMRQKAMRVAYYARRKLAASSARAAAAAAAAAAGEHAAAPLPLGQGH
jgi:hypothetical protein